MGEAYLLKRLVRSPDDIPLDDLQFVLNFHLVVKRRSSAELESYADKLVPMLWGSAVKRFSSIDKQILCSICVYTLAPYSRLYGQYLQMTLQQLHDYQKRTELDEDPCFIISLVSGFYQSSLINQLAGGKVPDAVDADLTAIIRASLDLLHSMAYLYSQYTFPVFRALVTTSKLLQTSYGHILIEYRDKFLSVSVYNWENPINGVRDMNKHLFLLCLDMTDDKARQILIAEIDGFPWNKAKYLMIAEFLKRITGDVVTTLKNYPTWVEGCIRSLSLPSLVSAGTDMYFAIVRNTKNVDEWFEIFMDPIEKVFSVDCQLTFNNLCNYWLLGTFKKYPAIFTRFSEYILPSTYTLHCIISICKQGNKLGLLESKKKYKSLDMDFMTMYDEEEVQKRMNTFMWILHTGLYSSDPSTSMQAFDIVCMSRKNTADRLKIESHIVEEYVAYYCNSDSTNLRINMIRNVKLFLDRLHSYLSPLKPSEKEVENKWVILFCEAFSKMLYTNLKEFCHDSNYQRTITCLKVLQLYLDWIHRCTCMKETVQGAVSLYQYFHESRYKTEENAFVTFDIHHQLHEILKFLMNPSQDIRDCATEILLNHYLKMMRAGNYGKVLTALVHRRINTDTVNDIEIAVSVSKVASMVLVDPENCRGSLGKEFAPIIAKLTNSSDGDITFKLLTERKGQFHTLLYIIRVVIDTAWQLGVRIDKVLGENFIEVFLETAKDIPSMYSARSNHDKTSPDFSEMNEVVLEHIHDLGKPVDLEDAQMSGLYLTVLSGIWLTIKGVVELATSVLLQTDTAKHKERALACLQLVTNVLETCRHKGVIEAAGNCLGRCIRHLSLQQPVPELEEMPARLLDAKIKELVHETTSMPSVTRRGAGLSILVHKIVASDTKPNKPMFHSLICQLLQICTVYSDTLEDQKITTMEIHQAPAYEAQQQIESEDQPKLDLENQQNNATENQQIISVESQQIIENRQETALKSQQNIALENQQKEYSENQQIIALENQQRLALENKQRLALESKQRIAKMFLYQSNKNIKPSGTQPNMTSVVQDKSAIKDQKMADVETRVDLSPNDDLSTQALAKLALERQITYPPAVQVKMTSETQVKMTLQTLNRTDSKFPVMHPIKTQQVTAQGIQISSSSETQPDMVPGIKIVDSSEITDYVKIPGIQIVNPAETQLWLVSKNKEGDSLVKQLCIVSEGQKVKPSTDELRMAHDIQNTNLSENPNMTASNIENMVSKATPPIMVQEILKEEMSKIQQKKASETQVQNGEASEGVRDIPKAVFMHMLAMVVKDSSLGPSMLYYSPRLAELLFTNMASDQWQIRNAALQLYGSLVPKLIGQNTTSELENSAAVAFDELRMHSPRLWTYIREELSKKARSSSLIEHSDLVPIVSLLANMAYRYDFQYNIDAYRETHAEMLEDLVVLLGSPLQTLRRLTATSLLKMYTSQEAVDAILAAPFQTENFTHGSLLYLEQARQTKKEIDKNQISLMKKRFGCPKSFVCKSLSCVAFDEWPASVEETLEAQRRHRCAPGVNDWAKVCIKHFFATSENPYGVLELCLGEVDAESYLKYFLDEVKINRSLVNQHKKLHSILTTVSGSPNKAFVWEFLYELCQLGLKLDVHAAMLHEMTRPVLQQRSYVHRLALPLAVRLLPHLPMTVDFSRSSLALQLSRMALDYAHFDNPNVEQRMAAALACNEYAGLLRMRDQIKEHPGTVFCIEELKLECSFVDPDFLDDVVVRDATINIICAFGFLLVDEEEEVRTQVCYFFSIVMGFKWPLSASYLFYRCMSEPEFMHKLIPSINKESLKTIEELFIQKILDSRRPDNGPFSNKFTNPNVEFAFYRSTFKKLILNYLRSDRGKDERINNVLRTFYARYRK